MKKKHLCLFAVIPVAIWMSGCSSKTASNAPGTAGGGSNVPSFSLAWSEYPSWSVFGVADEVGLIDKDAGELGTLEEKWKVDVVLKQLDYDSCLNAYSSSTVDAVCITNMDVLAPAGGRNSVAILPTSTSDGADACIVTSGIKSVADLKGKESHGLEKSVSQYMFERALEELGEDPKEFPFVQKDPQLAAEAMQTQQDGIESIVVWNPFVMQTLRTLEGEATVLFDSKKIPEEIIDMVVVGEDALQRDGGESFAMAVVEAFYEVNKLIESADKGDETLIALGKKFSGLELDDMKVIVQQTKFYKTPTEGKSLFERADFQSTLMPRVIEFCATHDIIEAKPSVGYQAGGGEQLLFDTSYMTKHAGK